MDAALVILDGWGLGDHDRRNAVEAAETPTFERLSTRGAAGRLTAWGPSVGLPAGGMGNSEVGHLTIGAGRVVKQARTRIDEAIADGSFARNEAITAAFDHAEDHGGRVHLLGLVSDAGVHADVAHLAALLGLAAERDIEAVTHAFTDGRDSPPTSGRDYLASLERAVADRGTGTIATVCGRYYAMDRDGHWDRTRRAYEAIVERSADHRAPRGPAAVEQAYERGETDEFIEPTVIDGAPGVGDGDAVLCTNFRADRMRQLVGMLAGLRPDQEPAEPPDVLVVTMTEYDETFDVPVAFRPLLPEDTLGEMLAAHGRTQLRIAETEKYAHVTYFFNGGREAPFEGERREIVPSPSVPTYDLQPEMSAPGVTDAAISISDADDPDVLVLNYANADMVGHTGDFDATVAAVEAVDTELGRLASHLEGQRTHLVVVADHGNADDMGTPDDPHTAHTFNPVPFIYVAPDGTDGGHGVRKGGGLADVAPSLLDLLGIDPPVAMTGTSLLTTGG